jgi:hypothetical protein
MARAGVAVLLGSVAVLCFLVWFTRAHDATMSDALVLTLICFSFAWTFLPLWQFQRGVRRLGWKGLSRWNYTQLFYTRLHSNQPPDDPDLLFLWRWTLQLCWTILPVVLCVSAIAFAA